MIILLLVDVSFAKALQGYAACLSVNNNLFRKVVSPLELRIMFDDSVKITSVAFFVANFDLLNYELYNFEFKLLHWVISY